MVDTSHSKSVRGTLSNPKTQEAKNSSTPTPRLGDGTSLKPENDDPKLPENDSAPPPGQGNDTPSSSAASKDSAPTVSEPYRKAGTAAGGPDKKALGNGGTDASTSASSAGNEKGKSEKGEELPHSKTVRGTLANSDGAKVNKTQLGDPASLKAETSERGDMGREVEREGLRKKESKL